MSDYWIEHAEIALEEAGLPPATKEQLDAIAGVIENAHDCFSQSMGHDVARENFHAAYERKIQDAIREVEAEKNREINRIERSLKSTREDRDRTQWALHDARRELEEQKGVNQ